LPAASCSLPGTQVGRATPRPLFGLAPGGVYRATFVTKSPVRSYRTFSPLPVPLGGHRRSTLCGTFRRLSMPGRYPAPCPTELGLSSGGKPPAILTRALITILQRRVWGNLVQPSYLVP